MYDDFIFACIWYARYKSQETKQFTRIFYRTRQVPMNLKKIIVIFGDLKMFTVGSEKYFCFPGKERTILIIFVWLTIFKIIGLSLLPFDAAKIQWSRQFRVVSNSGTLVCVSCHLVKTEAEKKNRAELHGKVPSRSFVVAASWNICDMVSSDYND